MDETATMRSQVPDGSGLRKRKRGHRVFSMAGSLLLAISVLSFAVYQGHLYTLRYLSRSLTETAGVPITVDGLRGGLRSGPDGLSPLVIIEGIKVGAGETPLLAVQRAEAIIEPHLTRRPTIRRVRLIRPELRLRPDHWNTATAGRGSQSSSPLRPPRSPGGTRGVDLVLEDGSLALELPLGGRTYKVISKGIYLGSRTAGDVDQLRIVLGRTSVGLGGDTIIELAATSADLDPAAGFRPSRIASLGGVVLLPSSAAGSGGLVVHLASLQERLDGYLLRLEGNPVGRSTGRIQLHARLDPALRLRARTSTSTSTPGPASLTVALHDVDLSALAPLLARYGLALSGSRVAGKLGITPGPGQDDYTIEASLAARQVGIHHAMVAANTIGPFDGSIDGTLRLSSRGVLALEGVKLSSGEVALQLKGSLNFDGQHPVIDVDIEMPATGCQQVLASLPAGFVPTLQGMALKGEIGLRTRLRLDAANLDEAVIDLDLAPLTCKVLVDPPAADVHGMRKALTIKVSDARGQDRTWTLGPSNPDYQPFSRISRHIKAAFIVAEDSRFYIHEGFDKRQLKQAFITNLKENRVRRGASTISQQVIKNVFLHHKRTFSRKFQEAVLTWRMEQLIPKERILELYLNLVEMGPGVYGVGQATQHYFGRAPRSVTPLQAAHLAALTPSPRYYGQRFSGGDGPGEAWQDKLRMLLRMMRRRGAITRAEQDRWSDARLSLK